MGHRIYFVVCIQTIMVTISQAPELTIRQYIASLNLNPDNVFYQRIVSNNVTTAGAQWQITSPNKRAMLLSYAQVDWSPVLQRQRGENVPDPGAPENFDDDGDAISFKHPMAFTNAMTSQTISINGNSLTLSQPRRFIEPMTRMAVGRAESKSCFETQWWDAAGGNYANNRAGVDHFAESLDYGLKANENYLKYSMMNPKDEVGVTTLAETNNRRVHHLEPLIVPPFNPFAKVAGNDMPGYLPWGHMSPIIPNIDRIEIDIQFDQARIAAGTMYYRYAGAVANGNEVKLMAFNSDVNSFQAHLLLYWYEVPTDMSIPRSVDLQTWNLREFQTPINTVNNNVIRTNVTTDLLQLRSVPSYIIIHARRKQDVSAYVCASVSSDSNFRGLTAAGGSTANGIGQAIPNHSIDTFLQIQSLSVILGDRPNVISTQFTQRELYYLTLKNCKSQDFSLSFGQWLGPMALHTFAVGVSENVAAILAIDSSAGVFPSQINNANGIPDVATDMRFQHSKSFVVLQPKDIAEKISPGVFFPTSLQFLINFIAKDGVSGFEGANLAYDVFVHVVVAKHMLRLEPDRAQYQEQSMTLDAAESALKPGIVGGALTGGSSLSSLRQRGESSSVGGIYQSRF